MSARRTYMYRVPKHLRLMTPESYLPKTFHFGPYVPNFFSAPPVNEHEDGGGRRLKKIIVEDMLGKECFAALVENVKNQLEDIKTTYIELEISPAIIPDEQLATLFASSAAVIVASAVIVSNYFIIPKEIASNLRLPICNYFLALQNASQFVENQIPISLLTLACDAFYERGYRFQSLPAQLKELASNVNLDRSVSSKTMLLFLLRNCTMFGNHVSITKESFRDHEKYKEWIERNYNSHKSIMAFMYDFYVGSLDTATATAATSAANQIQIQIRTEPDRTGPEATSTTPPTRINPLFRMLQILAAGGGRQAVADTASATAAATANQIQIRTGPDRTGPEATSTTPPAWINPLFRMLQIFAAGGGRQRVADDDESFLVPPRMMSASQLRRYGVKFRKSCHGGFKAIRYEKETNELTLPVITMFDDTFDLFRNLIVYEITSVVGVYDEERMISRGMVMSTVTFFDYLIDTAEDVEVLTEAGVLRSYMERNTSSVAAMWDGLVTFMPSGLIEEHEEIRTCLAIQCKGWWPHVKWSLMDKYKQRPWLIVSALAAFLLLSLTIVQTAFSITSYDYAKGH